MKKTELFLSAGILLALSQVASAQAVDVAANFTELTDVARIIAVLIGFCLTASGIIGFYQWSKTGGMQGNTVGKNVTKLLIGSLLVIIPWVYELVKASIGVEANTTMMSGDGARMILALDDTLGTAQATKGFLSYIPPGTFKAILAFVMFIGFIAFVSGIYSLKDISDPNGGGKQHPILSPLLRIIGGVICMNILWASCFISSLVGISTLCIGR